jgi:hypothetical protein
VSVGINADKPLQQVLLMLDGASHLRVIPTDQSAPVFVTLPQLDLGSHQLRVQVQNAGPNPAEHNGALEFLIRAPRARLDAYRSLFRVDVDPERASLDDFWRGAVNIEVYGPEKRLVIPRLEVGSEPGLPALAQKTLPEMSMPVTAAEWKKAFRAYCSGDPTLENYLDEAKDCRLHFDAGELGESTVRFEHERRPLRWHAQRTNHGFRLRLVNEAFDDDATLVDVYSFAKPDQPMTQPGKDFATAVDTPPPSGLFLARNGKVHAGIVTPPALVLRGLASLGISPALGVYRRQPDQIATMIHTYAQWSTARIIHHPLAFSFRQRVLLRIESAISDLVYQETKILGHSANQSCDEAGLGRLRTSINEPNIRLLLQSLRVEVLKVPTRGRPECVARQLLPLLKYGTEVPSPDPNNGPAWIAEFALRLASAPETLLPWAEERLQPGLRFLLKYPLIMRVARYIVLASDVASGARPLTAGPLHEGWEW